MSDKSDNTTHAVFSAITQIGRKMQDALTGHNPIPEMPLEIELLIVAWDNVKKNYLDGIDGYSAQSHEIAVDDICAQIDELMMNLVEQFHRADIDPKPGGANAAD